jgi:hypothetical protein
MPPQGLSAGAGREVGAKFLPPGGVANGRFRIKLWGLIEEPRTAGYGALQPVADHAANGRKCPEADLCSGLND